MFTPKLQTARLYLREFTLADAAILLDMHQDPEITRYTYDPVPWSSLEQTENILKEIIMPQYENGIGRWAVHLKETGEFIGWCGLKNTGEEIDLGYRFIRKFWGNGYASEAARAVLQYGIQTLALTNIIGRADVNNQASVSILRKLHPLTESIYWEENGKESLKFRYT